MHEPIGPDQVWGRRRHLARNAAFRRLAVAYAGPAAADQVPCGVADLVIVDASDSAVSAGSTSPVALSAWLEAGAEVRSLPGLHAKIGVFGDAAMIGSANLSERSDKVLSEAVLITRDEQLVQDVGRMVDGLADNALLLDVEEIARLAKLAPPSSGGRPAPPRWSNGGVLPASPFRVYACVFSWDGWSKDTTQEVARAVRRERGRQPRDERYTVHGMPTTTTPWPLKPGDVVLFLGEGDDGNRHAWPPVQVRRVDGDVLLYLEDTTLSALPVAGPSAVHVLDHLEQQDEGFLDAERVPSILDAWDLDVMCPRCGSPGRVVSIGMPAGPPSAADDLRYSFYGCAVDGDEPQYVCLTCGESWGTHR